MVRLRRTKLSSFTGNSEKSTGSTSDDSAMGSSRGTGSPGRDDRALSDSLNTLGLSNAPPQNGYQSYVISDVVVSGAGPAGLMLATNLVRFGIRVNIIDDRPHRTGTGRADGLQPKSIETLRQMRLADTLLRKGVKVYDISLWKSTLDQPLHRTARETHYPSVVDVLDPYILLVHQGFVEELLLDDLKQRGIRVLRNTEFVDFDYSQSPSCHLRVNCRNKHDQDRKVLSTNYLIGCDGAHSRVRKSIPGCRMSGTTSEDIWGVLDGEIKTNFPDLWSKVVVNSEEHGSILFIPRERNMTRLYIEMRRDTTDGRADVSRETVMARGQEVMHPYHLSWKSVEWFGHYSVGQRIATRFSDDSKHIYITGDASHTHSPKAAQGMNTSMHDSWNLAWKLNLTIRGLAKPNLLETFEIERRKIAQDLVNFDFGHSNAMAGGDSQQLADNFRTNVRFISGVGTDYDYNALNMPSPDAYKGALEPGQLLPPAALTRFIDANPVQAQLDIPSLGQFRIYIFAHDLHKSMPFLDVLDQEHRSHRSFVGELTAAANASYTLQPPLAAPHDAFVLPHRYTPISSLFTYATVTDMPKGNVEVGDLPPIFRDSRWTFYMDDCPDNDTRNQTCMDKWLGGVDQDEIAIVNVRPDGYVGCLKRFPQGSRKCGQEALEWLDYYYSGFLKLR